MNPAGLLDALRALRDDPSAAWRLLSHPDRALEPHTWQRIAATLEPHRHPHAVALALQGARAPHDLEIHTRAALRALQRDATLHRLLAWALLTLERPVEALLHADLAAQNATPGELGSSLLCRAQIVRALGQPWLEDLRAAEARLRGRPLGLARLERGAYHHRDGDRDAARTAWRDALALLRRDPHHTAWTRYNLGIDALHANDPLEATRQFDELHRTARRHRAWLARSWTATAVTRRARGQWQRAENACRLALETATDPDDRRDALHALTLTQRYAKRTAEAEETLHLARLEFPDHPGLALQSAALRVERGHPLGPTPEGLTAADRARLEILRAETHRQTGNLEAARDALRDITALSALEEFTHFTDLHALSSVAPLKHPERLHITVRILSTPGVHIEDEPVPMPRACLELLALLLHLGGSADREHLAATLYPRVQRSSARRMLRRVIAQTRHALGWSESVVASVRSASLTANVNWQSDINIQRTMSAHRPEWFADTESLD